ncbi:MAG: DUF971 domain-containing protein [Acidobacteria bacterium]|nr:DUF971 domain-containing protein [Acidobacteriota bacterium]MBI3472167.1 DUF971 domain-containing protein [Candidatus Solibacter usitatus]
MLATDPRTEPEHISISKSKGIAIDWRDGHRSEYGLRYLRHHCPCAVCTGSHGTTPAAPPIDPSPFQMYQAALKMNDVEPVGHYAVRIAWNDGHSSGIYSYEHFRKICPCPSCTGATTGTGPQG